MAAKRFFSSHWHPHTPPETPTSARQSLSQDGLAEARNRLEVANISVQSLNLKNSNELAKKAEKEYGKTVMNASNLGDLASPMLYSLPDVLATEPVKATAKKVISSIPALLGLLEEVAKIHSFIRVAVGAFRFAIDLHLKRKDNDEKVSLVVVAMRDMMASLLQLKGIDKYSRAGKSNVTVVASMQNLVKQTAEDITNCAISCHAYANAAPLTRALQSGSWSEQFKEYTECFSTRRSAFLLALSIHTNRIVDDVNNKMDVMTGKVDTANSNVTNINQQMERVLLYLTVSMSPEQHKLAKFLDTHGGRQAVVEDGNLLQQLVSNGAGMSCTESKTSDGAKNVFEDLQRHLQDGVKMAIYETMKQFQQNFDTLPYRPPDALRPMMCDENNRIVAAITYGPHSIISNPIIRELWKEKSWNRGVNGAEFILALRDHLSQAKFNLLEGARSNTSTAAGLPFSHEEVWMLEYLEITRVQAILEGFGDEAALSGYITVATVNTFTDTLQSKNGSLMCRLAYWAVGHQMVMSHYAGQIDTLFTKMFALRRSVLPANQNAVNEYLHNVWKKTVTLTTAFRRPVAIDHKPSAYFKDYAQVYENNLIGRLEAVKFNIETAQEVADICGNGPIEQHIFPLLHLLLKRDFEIMRLARVECLHVYELRDSMYTIMSVFAAIEDRHSSLARSFQQQHLDVSQQFKIFAFETFKYLEDPDGIWLSKKLEEVPHEPSCDDDDDDYHGLQDIYLSSIVKYPLQMSCEAFTAHPSARVTYPDDTQADPHVRKVIGHWSGFCGEGDVYPSQAMISLDLHAQSPANPKGFQSKGLAPNSTRWSLTGECTVLDDGNAQYTFSITYIEPRYESQHFVGKLDESGTTLSGSWHRNGHDSNASTFLFKRLSPDLMRFYPTPTELAKNKPRALWYFALSSVQDQVSRSRASEAWFWLHIRWKTGQSYARLVMHSRKTSQLTVEENNELAKLLRAMTTDEARFFTMLADLCDRHAPIHWGVQCKACGTSDIRGTRTLCIACGMANSINLCEEERCLAWLGARQDDSTSSHLPSHSILKLRAAVPFREYGEICRASQSAMEKVRQLAFGGEWGGDTRSPKCNKCKQCTSLPNWYCIECKDKDIFMCVPCEASHDRVTVGTHEDTHAMVQYGRPLQNTAGTRTSRVEPHAQQNSFVKETFRQVKHFFRRIFST